MSLSQINGGGINKGPINGSPSPYVDGAASLETAHSISATAEPFHGSGPINRHGINTGPINGYPQTGDPATVNGSATLTTEHELSGDLTLASELYLLGAATLTTEHTLTADLVELDAVDGNATLTTDHTLQADLTATPIITGAATLTHGHDLEWTDTQSVLASSVMTHTHVVYATALGGTPNIDRDMLWWAAEPLLDIEPRPSSTRKTQYFGLTYNVDGFRYDISGLNFCPLNTHPLNQGCGAYPEPDISGQLDLAYGVGETQFSLDMQWDYMFDVTQREWELGQEYDLDVQTLVSGELDSTHAIIGKSVAETLLSLVNAQRTLLGLVPYTLYTGVGEDVATTHSQNMADTGVYAHEDGLFPVGYQTVQQRISHIVEGATLGAENLAVFADIPRHLETAQELFDIWWNSPPHKANMLYDWDEADSPQMLLGYSMLYDWPDIAGYWSTFYTQLFIGYGIPAGANLAQWQLDLTYQLDTVLITELNIGYDLDAYTPAFTQLESKYGINVAAQLETGYEAFVSRQHTAPIHFSLGRQQEFPWSSHEPVAAQHELRYAVDLYTRALQSIATPYDLTMTVGHSAEYSLTIDLSKQMSSPYEPSVQAVRQHEATYDVTTLNRVLAGRTSYWSLHDETVTVTNSFATLTLKR